MFHFERKQCLFQHGENVVEMKGDSACDQLSCQLVPENLGGRRVIKESDPDEDKWRA